MHLGYDDTTCGWWSALIRATEWALEDRGHVSAVLAERGLRGSKHCHTQQVRGQSNVCSIHANPTCKQFNCDHNVIITPLRQVLSRTCAICTKP